MALVDTQEVTLAINAQTAGVAGVSDLAAKVEALARQGGEAAPALDALAQEVRQLGEQKIRVDGLEAAIASAKSAWSAVREARVEVQSLDRALADAKGAGANRQAINLLQKELSAANRELAAAEKNWSHQTDALKTARAEAASMGTDVKNVAQAQQQLASAFDSVTERLNAQVQAVARARTAEQERAAQARAQAQEEDRLAAIVGASKAKMAQAAQQQLAAEKKGFAEAEAAAQRYAAQNRAIAASVQSAFASIGIRSSATIRAEILTIQQGLQRLATDAKTTGGDFDRAWAAGQKRIAALKAEMSGGVDPFTASVEKSTGSVGTLLTRLAPMAGAIAAAFSVDRIARAVVEFDGFNRSLLAITGSSQAAARELDYITQASQRLGLEIGSASKAYVQFMASTKGTALEGERARTVFEAVAGSMARLGKTSAETDGALLALSQMVGKGVVSMEELRQQLAERLPGAMQAAADGAGVTVAELTKMVESGQVLAEDLLPGLAAQLNKLYGTAGQAEGYTAAWNRLQNAVTTAAGELGQMPVVANTAQGAMWVLTKTVQGLAAAATDVLGGFQMVGTTIGAVAGAIVSGEWGMLGDFLLGEGEKIAAAQEKSRKAFLDTGEAATAAGQAAKSAADLAMQGNPGWLAVANAYSQVNLAADAYVKQAEKALQARQAEAGSINQFAQLAGTEEQQRQAEAVSALAVAAATDEVARAKGAQLATLQSQLAAQQQVVSADAAESDAKRKLIEATRQKIELAQQESAQAAAAAQQAALEAAARQAAAEAVRDHSAQLEGLRAAHERAQEAVRRLEADERAGLGTTEAVIAAKARAVQAAILYRDAVSDNIRAIEAQSRADQAAMSVEERNAQLKLAAIQGAEKSARAYGNETAAAWRAIEAKRQEARIAEVKAASQKAEAAAQLQKIAAQEKELSATDRLDKAKMAELEAAKASATAKQLEGQISAELAKQLHAEADAAIRAMNAKRGTAGAAGELADSAGDAAEGVQQVGQAMNQGIDVGTVMADIWGEARKRLDEMSYAANAAVSKTGEASKNFYDFARGVRSLQDSAAEFVSEDPLGELTQKMGELDAQAAELSGRIEKMDFNSLFGAGLNFQGWRDSLKAMQELELSLVKAKQAQVEFSMEVVKFNESVDAGNLDLAQQERTLSGLVARAEELGSQDLSGLRSALSSVRQEIEAARDASRSMLDSLSDELDQLNGRFVDIERRRAEQRRADIEAQRLQARSSGNAQAVADLDAALSKLNEIERLRIDEARKREQEAAARARADAETLARPSTTPTAAPTQTTVHRVDISIGGRAATVNTDAAGASVLTDLLKRLSSDMNRS